MGPGHRPAATGVAGPRGAGEGRGLAPDGSQIVSGGMDKVLRFWDGTTSRPNAKLGVNAAILALAWSPDGKTIACGNDQKAIELRDAETKKPQRILPLKEAVTDVVFSADGKLMAAADLSGSVTLWEAGSGKQLLADAKMAVAADPAKDKQAGFVAFSPDGKHLAAAGMDKLVRAWEIRSGLPSFELKGHTDAIRGLAWSPDGKTIVTCADPSDGSVRFWDIAGGNARSILEPYRMMPIRGVAWSADGSTLGTMNADSSIWLFDTKMGKPARRVVDQPGDVASSTKAEIVLWWPFLDPVARLLNGQTVKTMDVAAIAQGVPHEPNEQVANEAEVSGDFSLAAVQYCLINGTQYSATAVRIISLHSGKVLHVLKLPGLGRKSLSRDGRTLVTNPYDANKPRVQVWSTESGKLLHQFTQTGFMGSVALSSDGNKLAVEVSYGVLFLDTKTMTGAKFVPHSGAGPGQPESVPFQWLPDNKRVLARWFAGNTAGASYWVFEPESGRRIDLVAPGFAGPDTLPNFGGSVAFSPDSRLVAGSIGRNVLPIWATHSGRIHAMLLTYKDKDRPIHVATNPGGHYAWLNEGEDPMRYVVLTDAGQETLTPEEFSKRFGWQNDPGKVALTPAAMATPATAQDGDRRAAEWVLSVGGWVKVQTAGGVLDITNAKDLPSSAFQLLEAFFEANSQVTDAAMAQLEVSHNLHQVTIGPGQNTITDAAVEQFAKLPQLDGLYLASGHITDAGAQKLAALKRLVTLSVGGTSITDRGVEYIARCKNLEIIYLSGLAGLTDAGLEPLKTMPKLKLLYLHGTRITDAGLERLKTMPKLEVLYLQGTRITDAGLAHIAGIKSLRILILADTGISDSGLKRVIEFRIWGT